MNARKLNGSNFWDTDLEDVEAVFLPAHRKITDLPIALDDRIPSQGSVILSRAVNLDSIIKKPTIFQRIVYSCSLRGMNIK